MFSVRGERVSISMSDLQISVTLTRHSQMTETPAIATMLCGCVAGCKLEQEVAKGPVVDKVQSRNVCTHNLHCVYVSELLCDLIYLVV